LDKEKQINHASGGQYKERKKETQGIGRSVLLIRKKMMKN